MKIYQLNLFLISASLLVLSGSTLCAFTQSTTSLIRGRWNLAATSVGDYAIFAGGSSIYGTINNADVLHVPTREWLEMRLSIKRDSLAAASAGQYALFAGGKDEETLSDRVDIFNATSLKWTRSTLSEPRYNPTAFSIGKYAIFAGGAIGFGKLFPTASDKVDIFDSSTQRWSIATLSVARTGIAGAAAGKYALFVGGADSQGNLTDVIDILDTTTLQWTTAKFSRLVSNLLAVSVGRYALFAGGFTWNGTTVTAPLNLFIFDSATAQWSSMDLPRDGYPEGGYTATSVGQYALFGWSLRNNTKTGVYIFDTLKSEWTNTTLGDRRFWYAATSVGTSAMFGGGRLDDAPSLDDLPVDKVFVLEFDSITPVGGVIPGIPTEEGRAPAIDQQTSGSLGREVLSIWSIFITLLSFMIVRQ